MSKFSLGFSGFEGCSDDLEIVVVNGLKIPCQKFSFGDSLKLRKKLSNHLILLINGMIFGKFRKLSENHTAK